MSFGAGAANFKVWSRSCQSNGKIPDCLKGNDTERTRGEGEELTFTPQKIIQLRKWGAGTWDKAGKHKVPFPKVGWKLWNEGKDGKLCPVQALSSFSSFSCKSVTPYSLIPQLCLPNPQLQRTLLGKLQPQMSKNKIQRQNIHTKSWIFLQTASTSGIFGWFYTEWAN